MKTYSVVCVTATETKILSHQTEATALAFAAKYRDRGWQVSIVAELHGVLNEVSGACGLHPRRRVQCTVS